MANRQNLKCTDPGTFSSFKGLKLGHYNIRSMHLKFIELIDLVKLFDILCVSESWLIESYPNTKIQVFGYTTFRYDRVVNKVGGGLLIYVCNKMAAYCSIDTRLSRSNADIEIMVLNFTQDKHRLTSIIHVYRPPNGSYVNCLEALVDTCQDDSLAGREHWVIGDINIDLFQPTDSKTKLYKKSIASLNLRDVIDNITRPYTNRSGGTCIDLIATNCDIIMQHGTLPLFVSDHVPVYATRKKTKESSVIVKIYGRSYRNYVHTDFVDHLLSIDWTTFDTNINVDDRWSIMLKHIVDYLDVHCPLKEMQFRDRQKPWITRDILESIYERNQYMLEYCNGGKANPTLLEMAKATRRDINAKTRIGEENYFKDKLEKLSNNPTKFWRELNQLIGKTGAGHPEIILDHHITGAEVKGSYVPDYINSFFSSVGGNLFDGLGNAPCVSQDKTAEISKHTPSLATTVTFGQVIELVKKIEVHKASGIDNIQASVLKDALMVLVPQLTSLINHSLHSTTFPTSWASAKVVPLAKNGNLREIGNWRPISLLPTPSKIMERIVYTELYSFLEKQNLLSNSQFGFRKSRGTMDAVFTLVNDLYLARDKGEIVAACFLDVRKAFDSIHHGELLYRMRKLKFPKIYTDWLCSYLGVRSQRVVCNNKI